MLNNDEIQKIIEGIESGAYDVADVLEAIANAAKGEDVRAALYASVYATKNAQINGQPKVVTLGENMKNPDIKYLYLGSEVGYAYGYIYANVDGTWTKTNLYGEGFAPSAAVIPTETGARIVVTDGRGTTLADITNGTATDEQVETYVAEWLDDHPEATTTVEDASVTMDKLGADVLAALNRSGGLTADIKDALLACFEKVAWIDGDGRDYYDALEAALNPPSNLVSISAVFNSGGTVIYNTNTLDDLKQYLIVTALYDDLSTETIENYTLSGSLSTGTQTITVTYGGKIATFTVTVEEWLVSITAVYTQSGTVYTTDELSDLRSDLVVTATYADTTSETINGYLLSGTLEEGTSTITVTYLDKTDTFNVTVVDPLGTLYRLSAPATFNGTSDYIDTEVALASEDRSFTIAFTATNGTVGTDVPIFHCVTEINPWPGISWQRGSGNANVYALSGAGPSQKHTSVPITNGVTNKVVIRHTQGDSFYYIDSSTEGVRNGQESTSNGGTFKSSNKNLLIGCYQNSAGTKGRFWNGTINDFAIYNAVFTNDEVTAYLNGGA